VEPERQRLVGEARFDEVVAVLTKAGVTARMSPADWADA
jgi:hypothetical protein